MRRSSAESDELPLWRPKLCVGSFEISGAVPQRLRRHLRVRHGLEVAAYCTRWIYRWITR